MKVAMICCPFKTSFGWYADSLKTAIEKRTGSEIQWVASNCGCGDPIETGRQFQARKCDYFDLPIPGAFRSKTPWKRVLRNGLRSALLDVRARRYAYLSKDAEVVHFHQILNAFGSKAVFRWLNRPSNAARIVTVHELDADQLESPDMNAAYDQADAIIVHCEEMRQNLIRLKVRPEKIHIVLHGTIIPPPSRDRQDADVVFYGGHNPMHGKGIQDLFRAMSMVRQRMGANAPTLRIHGHYGPTAPAEAHRLAGECGIAGHIVWLNQLAPEDTIELYQRSRICVLPYTGSFAGLPASLAAACRLPVVGTRRAGLPDHLGENGVWIEENNPEQIAESVIGLLSDDRTRRELGARLLARAQRYLSWDVIADRTLEIYDESARRGGRVACMTSARRMASVW
jgi:glycosyltransferase involved in cell wall biosynthesis